MLLPVLTTSTTIFLKSVLSVSSYTTGCRTIEGFVVGAAVAAAASAIVAVDAGTEAASADMSRERGWRGCFSLFTFRR